MSSDNHFKVVQRGAGANMSVDVSSGKAFVRGTTSNVYPVRSTATENAVIGNNSSGNPRIDAIVLYIDLAASANSDSSNVAKLLVVAGTPAASPTAPSDSDIQTAVGASNPFLRLADVAVANGETQIDTADITDQRVRFRTRHNLHEATDSDGATITFDVSQSNYHKVTLGGNRTLAVTGVSVGDSFVIKLKQDGTGNRTVTWWSNIDWFGGTPVLTPTASKVDAFLFVKKADGRYDGFLLGQDATDA